MLLHSEADQFKTLLIHVLFGVDAGQQVCVVSRFFLFVHQVSLRASRRAAAVSYDPECTLLAIATLCSYIVSQFCCTFVFASSGMTHAEHFEFTPPFRLEAGFAF